MSEEIKAEARAMVQERVNQLITEGVTDYEAIQDKIEALIRSDAIELVQNMPEWDGMIGLMPWDRIKYLYGTLCNFDNDIVDVMCFAEFKTKLVDINDIILTALHEEKESVDFEADYRAVDAGVRG